jgi:hypothetical protein
MDMTLVKSLHSGDPEAMGQSSPVRSKENIALCGLLYILVQFMSVSGDLVKDGDALVRSVLSIV